MPLLCKGEDNPHPLPNLKVLRLKDDARRAHPIVRARRSAPNLVSGAVFPSVFSMDYGKDFHNEL